MCWFHPMLVTSARLKTARSRLGPSRKFAGGGVLFFHAIANSLHHRRDALRGIDAGGQRCRARARRSAAPHGWLRGAPAGISLVRLPKTAERPRRRHRPPADAAQAIRDDDRVASVLREPLMDSTCRVLVKGSQTIWLSRPPCPSRSHSPPSVLPRLIRNTVVLETCSDQCAVEKESKCVFAGRTHPSC